jgi:hypothetical protein
MGLSASNLSGGHIGPPLQKFFLALAMTSQQLTLPKTKKHSSTLDRSSAFGGWICLFIRHPEWAKGNFLLCSAFLAKRGKLLGESHPLSENSPQTADKYQILGEKSSSRARRTGAEKRTQLPVGGSRMQ